MEKRESSYTIGGNVNRCSHCEEQEKSSKKKQKQKQKILKIDMLYNTAIQLLVIYAETVISNYN